MSDDMETTGVLVRTFAAELSEGAGRTIDVRVIPYGEQITHNDGGGGREVGVEYREEFVAGAFAEQAAAKGRERKVLVNVEHEQGLRGLVGHGLELREAADGFYGSFLVHDGQDGDKALMLVREGILDGVSAEFKALRSVRDRLGVVRRMKAHLFGVALCRSPAYKGAQILALREEAVIVDDHSDLAPRGMDPDLLSRIRAQGVTLPSRYDEAHLADADTSPEGDTSESDTGHSIEDHSTEEV